MDDQLGSHPSMPLLPRVDRLDCLMKYLAGKASLWRGYSFSFGKKKREFRPLDVAVHEAQSKETLLDRIGSLEARLVQLSLEIESRKSSNLTSASASASTFSAGRETDSSYPTFNYPKRRQEQPAQIHEITNCHEIQSKREKLQQKKKKKQKKEKETSIGKQKLVNNNKKGEKKCKNGKKGIPSSWPHLRLLGC